MTYKEKVEKSIEDGNAHTLGIIFDTFDTDMVMAGLDQNKIAKAKSDYLDSIKVVERVYNEALKVKDGL